MRTALSERLGIDVPVVQAPVGSAAGPELAAAVSAAGGLGLLALTWQPPDQARRDIHRVRRLTARPFGVNLVLDFPVTETLALCRAELVPVISTFWGDPGPVSERIRRAGALHMHTVGGARRRLRRWWAIDAAGGPQHRYGDVIPRPGMTGDVAGLALYAGQSAGLVHDVQPAGRLVERIAAQATAVIAGLRDPA